jgi:hypothetical protein
MKNILEFLSQYEEFEILTYSEDMIFNKPIEVSFSSIKKTFGRNGINVMFSLASIQIGSLLKKLFNMSISTSPSKSMT